jgi:hypothetical protein
LETHAKQLVGVFEMLAGGLQMLFGAGNDSLGWLFHEPAQMQNELLDLIGELRQRNYASTRSRWHISA